MTSARAKDTKGTVMAIGTRETSETEKPMAKVSITGPTGRSMMASGAEESKTATGCGGAFLEIATWASGKIAKLMDTEFISGKMGTDMRAVGKIA